MEFIKDRNAGNSHNTTWKPTGIFTRNWCVKLEDGKFLRDKKNRVRRFSSKSNAMIAVNAI